MSTQCVAFILLDVTEQPDTVYRQISLQVVLGKPVHVVAEKVSPHVRLALLSPDELGRVEEQNRKDNLLHVGVVQMFAVVVVVVVVSCMLLPSCAGRAAVVRVEVPRTQATRLEQPPHDAT